MTNKLLNFKTFLAKGASNKRCSIARGINGFQQIESTPVLEARDDLRQDPRDVNIPVKN